MEACEIRLATNLFQSWWTNKFFPNLLRQIVALHSIVRVLVVWALTGKVRGRVTDQVPQNRKPPFPCKVQCRTKISKVLTGGMLTMRLVCSKLRTKVLTNSKTRWSKETQTPISRQMIWWQGWVQEQQMSQEETQDPYLQRQVWISAMRTIPLRCHNNFRRKSMWNWPKFPTKCPWISNRKSAFRRISSVR